MRVIYFGDMFGEVDEERDAIQLELSENGITLSIEATDEPPWKEKYDILFFDWGGMSVGNSMLEHFCRFIIEDADKYPGRIFIMTSRFTEEAMEDALSHFYKGPDNIYLSIEKALPILKFISTPERSLT